MKILVTGGAGYIGSHVVLALCEGGYEVVVLDDLSTGNREAVDDRAEFIQGSTLNNDNMATALHDVDAVIHLAAFKAAGESMIDPGKYSQNNISGTISLLNAMMTNGVDKFIFSSTAAVYGYPKYLPLDENHPLEPINYYGFTKLEIERILNGTVN
jgi:UDP-galactose 4-epimerase (EC 5.1.3.2)